ncbi:predicted protein [Sclerotinia sclerotiorum 1980 UF-70]|uniref:Uncharacterized protein n=1 Tax=Sclerotinia sclerotiorum (strain ATCC 18683 / 1980 / Ss-1) TaxID=665079 RepID=A7EL45_SCLS1|nr:predicted protein [Sclerotinia sclerotiorum 1980 UF-70]EDO03561.1 predicted protein [Sclerotinia sclerotiorum 1980 UF-70]
MASCTVKNEAINRFVILITERKMIPLAVFLFSEL